MSSTPDSAFRIHVHDTGARALALTRAMLAVATQPDALDERLGPMCQLAADLARADVVSVYLRARREGRDVLRLAGSAGLPVHAVGHVELELFEGISGVVAERRRPVSVAPAIVDDARVPAYLGVPLRRGDEVVGVLALQRRPPRGFDAADVTLAASLTAPFLVALAS